METGHAKNVANFEQVIIILTALGTVYNPSQALILLSALQTKLTEAKAALDAVDAAEADKTIKVDEIQDEIEGLDKYVVNIKRTAEVELNDPAFTADLQSVVNKFASGSRKTGLPDDPSTPDINESRTKISTSQRSRDNQIAHLADILALLRTKSGYKPNDPEYTIAAIEAKLATLTAKNNAAKASEAALGNALDARDAVLYDPETGVLKLVKLIKTQLAVKPGKSSAAYQQINALEFRKY
ncbi:MAG TPA: hypothetical protein VNB22_02480 [Pyrinomonadaceae bacterium]|jgi:hypothetical protein|nr:hypothetical protein [Pyrinomonadaceae bacterium]